MTTNQPTELQQRINRLRKAISESRRYNELCDARDWGTIEIEFPKGSDDEDDSDILAVCDAAEKAEAELAAIAAVLPKTGHDTLGAAKDVMCDLRELRAELAACKAALELLNGRATKGSELFQGSPEADLVVAVTQGSRELNRANELQRQLAFAKADNLELQKINELARSFGYGQGELDCDLSGCLSKSIKQMEAQLATAKAELTKFAVESDEMSFHGELLRCQICGGIGTQAGMKRGVGDEPVNHELNCILAARSV
jgi:hypothetical protein